MKLPYKYRGLVYLCLLCGVLPLLVVRYALADTAGAWFDCRRLMAELERLPPEGTQTAVVIEEAPEMIFSGALLSGFESAAQGVTVSGYVPSVSSQAEGAAVHTAQLTASGSFASLLRAVEHVERKIPQCRIRSLVWQLTDDRSGRRLTLTLYAEQLVCTKSETR